MLVFIYDELNFNEATVTFINFLQKFNGILEKLLYVHLYAVVIIPEFTLFLINIVLINIILYRTSMQCDT